MRTVPPLFQRDEHSTLREVVIGHTIKAAYPAKSAATKNFSDHIPYLAGDFYDKLEEGQYVPFEKYAPEMVEAYNKLHKELKEIYEAEGVIVNVIEEPTEYDLNYFGWGEGTGFGP